MGHSAQKGALDVAVEAATISASLPGLVFPSHTLFCSVPATPPKSPYHWQVLLEHWRASHSMLRPGGTQCWSRTGGASDDVVNMLVLCMFCSTVL